jgi:hypothetical protein
LALLVFRICNQALVVQLVQLTNPLLGGLLRGRAGCLGRCYWLACALGRVFIIFAISGGNGGSGPRPLAIGRRADWVRV